MRKSLTHILESDRFLKVVGTAVDGKDAIRKVKMLHPDVVLLDIEMPVMDGHSALSHIMAECPTPVLMLSALNKREETIAFDSLENGAVDFIPKPSGVISYDIDKLSDQIINKVKVAALADVSAKELCMPKGSHRPQIFKRQAREKMVVIGSSTGGPKAVARIVSALPDAIPASILIVQHMMSEFVPSFVDHLQERSALRISTAKKGEIIDQGRILIAPGGYHTRIVRYRESNKISLTRKSPHQSIDSTMKSAAKIYGSDTIGVLLTGMGKDGVRGLKAIKEVGGCTIAEDSSTCVIFGMPRAAIESGYVDRIAPIHQIAQTILSMMW